MLKKAGIVVAAAAAGLLAVSPLAFATEGGGHGHGHGPHGGDTYWTQVDNDFDRDDQVNSIDDSSSGGLINVGDVNALQNVCPSIPVAAGLGLNLNVLGLLADAAPAYGAAGSASDVNCSVDQSTSQLNANRD